ncbi:unnamed protein product [Musa acuminata subsp. malaccensis]|uniref:(wild Malaysian banana) hypothetical protein n=1 Tax=Musa acuminata subsp. malaccensis TaxID=214687 RepID=A0A804J2K2_MUSAM|nr:unnamed protein product [Musa acuminata subsp. malaccensis]
MSSTKHKGLRKHQENVHPLKASISKRLICDSFLNIVT